MSDPAVAVPDADHALTGWGTAWTSAPESFTPDIPEPVGATVMLHGLTGTAVHLAIDAPPEVMNELAIPAAFAPALRLGMIMMWSGELLLGIGAFAIATAAMWSAPELSSVAATYGFTGTIALLLGHLSS